jgi:magnesium-transporting ATPase (P-type)
LAQRQPAERSGNGNGGGNSPAFVNALVGLRQACKAENAMNALQSMMKATARVRRDGAEAEIPAEQVVAGDVVLITAGDEVPADGRIVTSSALQIDEPTLTGESVPAAKDAGSTFSQAKDAAGNGEATGKNHYGSVKIGQSMGLVAFCLMLVVAAFEARSETETAFNTDTFNSSRMNLIALAEVAAAFLITQADFMQRLLGTAQLTARQWRLAFLAAVVLLLGWEAGKWIARRRTPAQRLTLSAG